MKKIDFGYSNDINPTGSYEGIGIKPGLLLSDADYYGSFNYNTDNYIVAKVTEDKYNNYPQLLGTFIVRQALVDMFADGSGILFLDQQENQATRMFEDMLNRPNNINNIKNIDDVKKILKVYNSTPVFRNVENNDTNYKVIATSIRHEEFESKNYYIKNCHSSISNIMKQLMEQTNELKR